MGSELVPIGRHVIVRGNLGLERLLTPGKPAPFDETIYVAPIPHDEISALAQDPMGVTQEDYHRFAIMKRSVMRESFHYISALAFAIMNCDGVRRMKNSMEFFREHYDAFVAHQAEMRATYAKNHIPYPGRQGVDEKCQAFLSGAGEIIAQADSVLGRLASYPTDEDASKKISDLCAQYNTMVKDKLLSGLASLAQDIGISGTKKLRLYTTYGITTRPRNYETYDEAKEIFASGWRSLIGGAKVDKPASDTDFENLRFDVETRSGVTLNIKYTPNNFSHVDEFYDLSANPRLKNALQPIDIRICTGLSGSVHADFFEAFFNALRGGMEKISGRNGNSMMIFCPDYARIANPGAVQLQLNQ